MKRDATGRFVKAPPVVGVNLSARFPTRRMLATWFPGVSRAEAFRRWMSCRKPERSNG